MESITTTRELRISDRSLAALYERHADQALGLAYLLTGDRALAEDLMHDAFVRVARRFVQIREPDAFGSYLRRAVVNGANSHFRRRAIERRHLAAQVRPDEAAEADAADRVTVRRALLRLPVRQRTALVLRFYEDIPEREIAELMRCRLGAVKQLVYRAMQTLRRELGEEER
jgi:RNA polymerase sigma-70 factor (sigma-E family)